MTEREGMVSVVIPVWNSDRYLGEAIESVLAQTYSRIEIIVVDDGSSDRSAAVAKGFGPGIKYCHQPNRGAASARNRGVGLAEGEYIAFLDADDVWLPGKLSLQIEAFKRDLHPDMVFGYVRQFKSPELYDSGTAGVTCSGEIRAGYIAGTMVVKKKSFFRAGMFSEELRIGEFIDWYSRAIEKGLAGCLLKEVVTGRRVHDSNMGIRERGSRIEYVRVLKASLDRRKKMKS